MEKDKDICIECGGKIVKVADTSAFLGDDEPVNFMCEVCGVLYDY